MMGNTTYRNHTIIEAQDTRGTFYRVVGHEWPGSTGIDAVALHAIARDEVDLCVDGDRDGHDCPVEETK